jgi:hypothetical protein
MSVPVAPLTRWRHVAVCAAAVVLSCGLLALFGVHKPALTLLHRWFLPVALIAALILAALMAVALRGWAGRSLLAVPAAALMSYAAAPLAFHLYFALAQSGRWAGSIAESGAWKTFVLTVMVWPTFTFVWAFGALAGALYLVLAVLLEGQALVAVRAWLAGLRVQRR